MLDLYDELKNLTARLRESGIDYALCGGLALAVYGIPRSTVDVDILIERNSLSETSRIAKNLGYIFRAEPMTFAGGKIEIHRISKPDQETGIWFSLDILLVTPALQTVWETRKEMEWEEGKISVVSREGLILLKSLRGSGQDVDDIQKLKDSKDEG